MSNRDTLIKLANTWDDDACGAALDVLGVPRETTDNSGHDTPDGNGLVAFTGLRAGHPRADWRFHVDQIIKALPEGHARDIGVANIAYVNALNMIEGIESWAPLAGVIGTGDSVHVDGHSQTIPKALVFAPRDARSGAALFDTVAKATEYLNNLPDSAFG